MRRRPSQFVCLLLAFVLACACSFSIPQQSFADVRATDSVKGTPLARAPITDAPDIDAEYAGLCTEDGLVLWERNGMTPTAMASCTKVMTAVVAIENCAPETSMYVTYGAATTDGTSANLQEGDTATMRDLLLGLLVPSGNDAAVAIAENVAGNQFAFVDMMNAKALDLGMTNTHFVNASGLDEDNHYTTVDDYYKLVRYAMGLPLFREIVGKPTATATIGGRVEEFESTNVLFDYMDGVTGIKTGTTDAAGYCLIASVKHNGIELYAIIFGASTPEARFDDAQTLLEWGFTHYRQIELINATIPVGRLALTDWPDKTVDVYAANPATITIFDYSGEITQEVKLEDWGGALQKGARVGTVIWSQNGEVLVTLDLIAAETVNAPGFWEGIKIWWSRLWGGFSGVPDHATTEVFLPTTFAY
ncbi:MAG: D-alanyl-D-alanine carboxypeptidase [Coriobacteriales bacterium]|nr:D-alanyl-D-alanine carboxypeptidase [Coriobacteriales bacterium]